MAEGPVQNHFYNLENLQLTLTRGRRPCPKNFWISKKIQQFLVLFIFNHKTVRIFHFFLEVDKTKLRQFLKLISSTDNLPSLRIFCCCERAREAATKKAPTAQVLLLRFTNNLPVDTLKLKLVTKRQSWYCKLLFHFTCQFMCFVVSFSPFSLI